MDTKARYLVKKLNVTCCNLHKCILQPLNRQFALAENFKKPVDCAGLQFCAFGREAIQSAEQFLFVTGYGGERQAHIVCELFSTHATDDFYRTEDNTPFRQVSAMNLSIAKSRKRQRIEGSIQHEAKSKGPAGQSHATSPEPPTTVTVPVTSPPTDEALTKQVSPCEKTAA